MKNTGKKFFALTLALAMTIGLAGCSKDEEIPYTLEEILTTLSDDTNVDELMAIGDDIQIIMPEETQEIDFMESVSKLEAYIELSNDLAALGIRPAETSTDAIAEKYSNISIEDARLLLETLSSDEITDVEKARVKAGLSYVLSQNKDWITNNGLNISEELLKRVIKAAGCEASGLEVEYYNSCKISARNYSVESSYIGEMEITDPISNTTLTYQIANNKGALTDATTVLYNIQALEDDETYETVVDYCNQALTASKIAIAAGVDLDDNTIKSESKTSDAKKLILEMYTPEATESQEG